MFSSKLVLLREKIYNDDSWELRVNRYDIAECN